MGTRQFVPHMRLDTNRLVFSRGKSGGQVRDEYRDEYDPGRGGYGRAIAEERQKEEDEYGRGR